MANMLVEIPRWSVTPNQFGATRNEMGRRCSHGYPKMAVLRTICADGEHGYDVDKTLGLCVNIACVSVRTEAL